MAGMFEVFLDPESKFRFRLLGPDGAVMAVSQAFENKPALVAGIAAVRECAGTGLVTDSCATQVHPSTGSGTSPSNPAEPVLDDQSAARLHALAGARGLRHHASAGHRERRTEHNAVTH